MERCWEFVPEDRPDCAEIKRVIAEFNIPDTRPASSMQFGNALTFWTAFKGDRAFDYERISDILLGKVTLLLRGPSLKLILIYI